MFGLLCPGNDGLIPYILQLYAKQTRKAGGMTSTFNVAEGFKKTFCRPCPLHLVGVWDTVSSVGWIWDPVKLPYTGRNPDVANGRHAMSIDERRCKFHTRLWGDPFPGQTIKQVWFAGVHCDVGGGYPPARAVYRRSPCNGCFAKPYRWACSSIRTGLTGWWAGRRAFIDSRPGRTRTDDPSSSYASSVRSSERAGKAHKSLTGSGGSWNCCRSSTTT